MLLRHTLICGALLVCAVPLRAQEVEYATGTTRYRISTTTSGSQSSPMGSSDFELGMRQQITLSVAKQARDTLVATITLDSITMSGAAATADVSALVGAKFVSLVSPTGRVYSTRTPTSRNPTVSQIAEGISRYLPAYHANLHTGMSWSDTTSGRVNQQGMDVDRRMISDYLVERDTTIGGVKAFKVTRATSVTAAGSGTPQGTPVSMESTSSSTGAFYVSSKGAFLGATSSDAVHLKLTILAQGAEITMKQNARTRIEPIE